MNDNDGGLAAMIIALICVLTVETVIGILREVLRPDICPPNERARKRA